MIALVATVAVAKDFYPIKVEDPNGKPFPCITLETIHGVRYTTDAGGWAAVYEPGLMGQAVWFTPSGTGVVAPVDGFGIPGVQVTLAGKGKVVKFGRSAPSPLCDRGDIEQRLIAHGVPTPQEMHELKVVDVETGAPVPAVRLTIDGQESWTDNGGRVAWFDLDDMVTQRTADVWSHGYVPQDDVAFVPTPGARTVLRVERTNLAERLVRLTGGGIWRDTVLLGKKAAIAQPVLDGQVLGQDTAHAVEFRGGLFWVWGDTNRPSYPLGNFHTTAALSALDVTPETGIDYDYQLAPDGFVKGVAPEYDEGAVWLGGLVALSDDELWASFMNVSSSFELLREGMVRWDDSKKSFLEVFQWDDTDLARPTSPAFLADDANGERWVLFRSLQRVPADAGSMGDPSAYESWTPLRPDGVGFVVERDADGLAVWDWRSDAPAPTREMVAEGDLDAADSPWHQAVEPDTGETPELHQGAVAWNPWRGRWVHVYTESFGATSLIGEIWYAEGDTPLGPWTWSRKVITHDDYSFYNPYLHPWFASRGGRRILFEGTYTAWLGNDVRTPRHDYNQQLYGLDLDDEALALPVAFYASAVGPVEGRELTEDARQLFGAWDLPVTGSVAVRWSGPSCDPDRSLAVNAEGEVAFHAHPAGTVGPGLADLVEWSLPDGTLAWSVDDLSSEGGLPGPAIASVWIPVWKPDVPLSQFPLPERADAGSDQCGALSPVALDGTGSHLSDGIDAWTWTWDGGSASGETPVIDLPPGVHAITLEIAGPSGDAEDVVVIEVD